MREETKRGGVWKGIGVGGVGWVGEHTWERYFQGGTKISKFRRMGRGVKSVTGGKKRMINYWKR